MNEPRRHRRTLARRPAVAGPMLLVLGLGCAPGGPAPVTAAELARDTAVVADADGDGVPDGSDGCPADPTDASAGPCGCGVPDTACAWCGDGRVDPPEQCDDGGMPGHDGCDAACALEALTVVPVVPAVAGVTNILHAQAGTPGAVVWFLGGTVRGAAPVPGCPGQDTGLRRPYVLGGVVADAGGHAFLAVWPPPTLAGREVGLVAVELDTCRVSDVRREHL